MLASMGSKGGPPAPGAQADVAGRLAQVRRLAASAACMAGCPRWHEPCSPKERCILERHCSAGAARSQPPLAALSTAALSPSFFFAPPHPLQETTGPEGSYALPAAYQPGTPQREGPVRAREGGSWCREGRACCVP